MKLFLKEVSLGLSKKNKKLSSKWFYDFRGSKLFEQITKLKTYYPTRTERKILKDNKTTSIIVSHDFDDALSMSDKVIVIEDGTIIQSGSAKDITPVSYTHLTLPTKA